MSIILLCTWYLKANRSSVVALFYRQNDSRLRAKKFKLKILVKNLYTSSAYST